MCDSYYSLTELFLSLDIVCHRILLESSHDRANFPDVQGILWRNSERTLDGMTLSLREEAPKQALMALCVTLANCKLQ
jgi:hypothetical protein